MTEGQEVIQCPACKSMNQLVTCPNQGCGTVFLALGDAIQFQCPICHVQLADTAKLAEMKRQQETVEVSAQPKKTETPVPVQVEQSVELEEEGLPHGTGAPE